jgi:hypothetical protein
LPSRTPVFVPERSLSTFTERVDVSIAIDQQLCDFQMASDGC